LGFGLKIRFIGSLPFHLFGFRFVVLAFVTHFWLSVRRFSFRFTFLAFVSWFWLSFQAQPLFAVGMEGFWGGIFCILALPVLQWMSLEDSVDAWYKMTHSKELAISSILSMLSIALVNSFGVAITKSMR
jgi:hypothetical protein